MKKRYITAIIAILGAILAFLQQWMKEEYSVKPTSPSSACQMVDSAMGLPYIGSEEPKELYLQAFLTSSEEGLGYYYGSYLEDVIGDDFVAYKSAVMKDIQC